MPFIALESNSFLLVKFLKKIVKFSLVFSAFLILFGGIVLFQIIQDNTEAHIFLERSVPFIGTDIPRMDGIDGAGIKVAVIDTGVDFNHPDLFGFGPEGKVVGGYNFINEGQPPLDTNGHGTQVAGVIAADGQIKGVAPKAKILAYKVSENGEGVSSDLITRAINMAIEDGADIINISLGVNKTNPKIDRAVNNALEKEIFVVTAAGNDGPDSKSIGSPGRNFGAVTVGATYNNLTSSLVATLEVDGKPYTVIPMVGSTQLSEPISGKIIFGGYGKEEELRDLDVKDSILIVERGSDVEGELLYFSIKEKNAVNAGAKALIVYNNQPGIFLGELIHEFMEPGYKPKIPVVSIDREEGLEIKNSLDNGHNATIHLFYNPDFVAHFSSRGPVSPFYIKPELVAPGAYINTTQNNAGYNFTSGTSYAAPHVSGAAALLLQKNPQLHHHEVKSILLTTVEPVSDAYGQEFSVNDAGSGRLDIGNAYNAKLVITPPNFVASISSDNPIIEKEFNLKLIDGTLENLSVNFDGPSFINFAYSLENNILKIKLSVSDNSFGEHEGKIIVNHDDTKYIIPFILHYTPGSVSVSQQNQDLVFDVYHPEEWSFVKISVTNSKDGVVHTTTTTPNKKASIKIYENSIYWIDAKIRVGGNTSSAYNTIQVNTLSPELQNFEVIDIPEKQVTIIAGIVIVVGMIGLIIRKQPI
ncbi:MAG: S8 family serine peptidase [Nitrosopumilus sp.]|uniref:S8 family serine peptidase n=1 Tax=Nitrosopumilus sp. TaxID=2024843 RepID=UPI00247BBC14|nr:S8 family serine peptidase [Nitrosopumilus sp.]MCV0393234.1 S8 family serine peptidase [Nitrosopumilus sp.]